jgi:biopolymer transport protein ExbD
MAIHEPGRVLMHHVPLNFVQKKVVGGGHRSINANLSLTSMIDFLTVTVVFLLMSFSASGETPIAPGLTLPKAANTQDMLDAPVVAIHASQILVDGQPVGNTRNIEDADHPSKIDELFTILAAKKALWLRANPDKTKAFTGIVVLQIDQHTKAVVVKSVFQTAAVAGYPRVNFMVDTLSKGADGQ